VFLDVTLRRNPKLIETALAFHREGVIPPNCFVIDSDVVAENATLLHQAARRAGLGLYFTTKQIGFNPLLARCVVEAGISKAIAIDVREASVLARNQIPIGHIGHLVQIPSQLIGPMLRLEPEVITVFSVDKARQIAQVTAQEQREVRLLLRVVSEGDFVYPGQAGGLRLDTLAADAALIQGLPYVRIVGVTSYPCLQLDAATQALAPTQNFSTILQAARVLREELGITVEQINAPGNTCVASMGLLAEMGATHGEPGHALTGTTYLHAHGDQAERPAIVYVSEVSHLHGNQAQLFGGGTYRRARVHNALVGSGAGKLVRTEVLPLSPTAIDYYVALVLPPDHPVRVGDTVILASRVQVFVSRSYVAVARGIQAGRPILMGLFDSWGSAVERVV
jgi:predicted amino acid racemase